MSVLQQNQDATNITSRVSHQISEFSLSFYFQNSSFAFQVKIICQQSLQNIWRLIFRPLQFILFPVSIGFRIHTVETENQ